MIKPNQAQKQRKTIQIKVNIRKWLLIFLAILGTVLALLWFSDRECSVSWFFFEEIASYTKSIGTVLSIFLFLSLITLLVLWRFIKILKKNNRIKQKLLENRFWTLIGAAFVGILLGYCWVKWNGCFIFTSFNLKETIGINKWTKGIGLDSSLITLLLAVPTLLVLWIFRTHDTRDNILTNILTHALDMIADRDYKRRSMGLIQLGQLKKQTQAFRDFDDQIDAATRNLKLSVLESVDKSRVYHRAFLMKTHLNRMDLSGADLTAADLRFTNLRSAKLVLTVLTGADLTDASLVGVDLRRANLTGVDLRGADLRGKAELKSVANVRGVAYLKDTDLTDATFTRAKYNEKTDFPKGFNPEVEGMIKFDN